MTGRWTIDTIAFPEPSPAGGRGHGEGGRFDHVAWGNTDIHADAATLTPALSRQRGREVCR